MCSFSAYLANRSIVELSQEFGVTVFQVAKFLEQQHSKVSGNRKAMYEWDSLVFDLLSAEFPA